MQIKIYHNPRCSKSRQTLALIEKCSSEFEIVEYLTTPPNHQELDSILRGLDMEPRELMRKGEDIYKELQLANSEHSRDELIQIMISNPKLIERPIVVAGDEIVIGRPPENVLTVLP